MKHIKVATALGIAGAFGFLATSSPPSVGADSAVGEDAAFTVRDESREAYSLPAPILNGRQLQQFNVGRSIFRRQWAAVTSLNGDWGLGPTFNAASCVACHLNTGRGIMPTSGTKQLSSALIRVSIPGKDQHGGPLPHPHYGEQLQNHSLDGSHIDLGYAGEPVPPEAEVYVDWVEQSMRFPDGEIVSLRRPSIRIEKLNFGPLGADVMLSLRNAQPLIGLGLLDAIPENTILEIARHQRTLGFNGRPNRVWDSLQSRETLGRYGWKANQASLREQIAKAAIEDMGVASPYFHAQNCPSIQSQCLDQLPANDPEFASAEIASVEFWLRALAVPAQRHADNDEVIRGRRLFIDAQCAVCHVPELRTAAQFPELPQIANRTVRAYTDLLLHDMGEGLADGRPDFAASGSDWRTTPLWGLGLADTVSGSMTLLHDGRARSMTEAILWHGGEAAVSRDRFMQMSRDDRQKLIRFLRSL